MSVYEALNELEAINVTEAFGDPNYVKEIKNSTKSRTAAEYIKQGKKLYGLGDKEKAKAAIEKAKDLYQECIDDVNSRVKKHDEVQKVTKISKGHKITGISTKSVTDSRLGTALDYFERRLETCDALLLQWENKAGKSDLAETKAQLKKDREVKERKEASSGNESFSFIDDIINAVDNII